MLLSSFRSSPAALSNGIVPPTMQRSRDPWQACSSPYMPQTPGRLQQPIGSLTPGVLKSYSLRHQRSLPQASPCESLSAHEAAFLLDMLLRLYHLGMVSAFRFAAFQQQSGSQAREELQRLQVRLIGCCLNDSACRSECLRCNYSKQQEYNRHLVFAAANVLMY